MNPITYQLEALGFFWNGRLNAYTYKSNAGITLSYEEAKSVPLKDLEKLTKKLIAGYKKGKKNGIHK